MYNRVKWGSQVNPHDESILLERMRPCTSRVTCKKRSWSSTNESPSVVAVIRTLQNFADT